MCPCERMKAVGERATLWSTRLIAHHRLCLSSPEINTGNEPSAVSYDRITHTQHSPVAYPSLSFPNLQSCVSLLLSRQLQLHPFLQLMFWVDYTYSLWVGSVCRLCRAFLKTMMPLAPTSKIPSTAAEFQHLENQTTKWRT